MANITQSQYNIAQQSRSIDVKIYLLNYQFKTVGQLSGVTISSPTFTNNADSDVRRTCNLSLLPIDSSFDIKKGSKIWLDKYIKVVVLEKNEIYPNGVETNMGIYMINNPSRVYSAENNTLTIEGLDLMAKLTGLRNGNLEGMSHIIPAGQNVRSAIIATLELAGFTEYVVDECEIDVPNNINIGAGGTAYEILSKLRDIEPQYQIYFDVNGVFHYEKIPSGVNEQIQVDDTLWNKTLISYQSSVSFEDVKNVIEVYGKTHNIKYFGGDASIDVDTYKLTIDSLKTIKNNIKIGFTTNRQLKNPYISVNDFGRYPLKDYKGNFAELESGEQYYVCKWKTGEDYFTVTIAPTSSTDIKAGLSNSTLYTIRDDKITELKNGTTFTFHTPTKGSNFAFNPHLSVNDLGSYEIQGVVNLENDKSYKAVFHKNSDTESLKHWEYMGTVNPSAVIKEENPDSPFYVGGTLGEIRIVLSGGEYDSIFTDKLCMDRAKWELYNRCRLQDTITLTTTPIYWLDVNWLISITLPNKQSTPTTERYIIKQINTNTDVSNSQTITAMRYYPYYETE